MRWISPIGPVLRRPDRWASGGGVYHARRSRDGRSSYHEGIDLVAAPGTPIVCPVEVARFVRVADPYPDARDATLFGLLLRTPDRFEIKILYVDPDRSLVGQDVRQGEQIGISQSLQALYPGIVDHIHFEVWSPYGYRVDPTPFFYMTSGGLTI